MKKVFFSALLMGFAAVTFAGTPKSENNGATRSSDDDMVWYRVTYDASHQQGYIKAGEPIAFTGDQSGAAALGLCPVGNDLDCLRGYNTPPSLPTPNGGAGDDQVTKAEN